jgi:hypothetical protein
MDLQLALGRDAAARQARMQLEAAGRKPTRSGGSRGSSGKEGGRGWATKGSAGGPADVVWQDVVLAALMHLLQVQKCLSDSAQAATAGGHKDADTSVVHTQHPA